MNSFKQISNIAPGTKILFANIPADGHFNPLTGLAAYLKSIGCDVRWYTSSSYKEKVRRLGIPLYEFKHALDISANTDLDAIFPERKNHRSQISKLKFDIINVFIQRSPEYYADILDIYRDFKFEIMIADITFGGIPFVRDKMNIPVISISVVPLPETSRDLPPSGLGLTPSYSFFGKIKQSVLRFIADRLIFAEPTRVMRRILSENGIDPGNHNVFDVLIQKSTVVLQSGTPGLEYQRSDLSSHVHFAGPMLPHAVKKEGEKWFHEKLRQYEKVVLVTQGTVEKDISKLLIPTLEALKNSDCLVVVTTGGSQTEELKKNYPQQNIIIEDFIPFADVLPYVDVYVSNGGYGGVLLSIQHSVPMVVAGVHEGKNEINARVAFFELGINLGTERPGAAQIKKAVSEVMTGTKYTDNVKKLCCEFRRYKPEEICAKHVGRLLQQSAKQRQISRSEAELIY